MKFDSAFIHKATVYRLFFIFCFQRPDEYWRRRLEFFDFAPKQTKNRDRIAREFRDTEKGKHEL